MHRALPMRERNAAVGPAQASTPPPAPRQGVCAVPRALRLPEDWGHDRRRVVNDRLSLRLRISVNYKAKAVSSTASSLQTCRLSFPEPPHHPPRRLERMLGAPDIHRGSHCGSGAAKPPGRRKQSYAAGRLFSSPPAHQGTLGVPPVSGFRNRAVMRPRPRCLRKRGAEQKRHVLGIPLTGSYRKGASHLRWWRGGPARLPVGG